jgi:hypothetical protein
MANVLEKIVTGGGVLPALASGKFGDENRGFALGLLPGLMYKKDRKDDKKDNMPGAAPTQPGMKKGGMVKSSASKRADGCAQRGKTKGRMV